MTPSIGLVIASPSTALRALRINYTKQSRAVYACSGLPRGFAARNDEAYYCKGIGF